MFQNEKSADRRNLFLVVLSGPIEFHTGSLSIMFAFERAFFIFHKTFANIQNPVGAHQLVIDNDVK